MSQSYRLRFSRNALKLKVSTRIPAQLVAGTGVAITKANGVYTFDLDETEIASIATTAAEAVATPAAESAIAAAAGATIQEQDADLQALADNSTDGLWTHTGAGTGSARTITGTANEITVTNGNGVSGNPTLSIPSAMTLTGKTVTGGTFTGSNIVGTATNDNAAAGSVGEALLDSGTASFTSGIVANLCDITLSAGDWDISGMLTYGTAGATTTTDVTSAIATANNVVTSSTVGLFAQSRVASTADFATTHSFPPVRVSITGNTTYYLNARATFAVSTADANAILRARRVR